MANATDPFAKTVHGTDPQYLVEKITRLKIYSCRYWKESGFGLTSETIIDKVISLKYCGGTYGGNNMPTDFMCLVLKLLQLQPEKDIIIEFIQNEDFKYLRVIGAFYMRLVGKPEDIYDYLEPLYNDYRKIAFRGMNGWILKHIDEFIDELLHEELVCDIALPHLPKRIKLEQLGVLDERKSELDLELEEMEQEVALGSCSDEVKLEDDDELKDQLSLVTSASTDGRLVTSDADILQIADDIKDGMHDVSGRDKQKKPQDVTSEDRYHDGSGNRNNRNDKKDRDRDSDRHYDRRGRDRSYSRDRIRSRSTARRRDRDSYRRDSRDRYSRRDNDRRDRSRSFRRDRGRSRSISGSEGDRVGTGGRRYSRDRYRDDDSDNDKGRGRYGDRNRDSRDRGKDRDIIHSRDRKRERGSERYRGDSGRGDNDRYRGRPSRSRSKSSSRSRSGRSRSRGHKDTNKAITGSSNSGDTDNRNSSVSAHVTGSAVVFDENDDDDAAKVHVDPCHTASQKAAKTEKLFDKMFKTKNKNKETASASASSSTAKPQEVAYPEGSVEYWNQIRGNLGMKKLRP